MASRYSSRSTRYYYYGDAIRDVEKQMPRSRDTEPEDDEWDDDELPDGVYHEDEDDGEPTVKCPYCGNEVVETAQYCPRCENYISKEDAPTQPKSWFVMILLALALLAALSWAIGG